MSKRKQSELRRGKTITRTRPIWEKPANKETFQTLIDKEYNNALGFNMENGIKYIHPHISKTPKKFENRFRNLQSFIDEQLEEDARFTIKTKPVVPIDLFKEN